MMKVTIELPDALGEAVASANADLMAVCIRALQDELARQMLVTVRAGSRARTGGTISVRSFQ